MTNKTTISVAVVCLKIVLASTAMGVVSVPAQPPIPNVTSHAQESRNRAIVLLVGEALDAGIAQNVQARWEDEIAVSRLGVPGSEVTAAEAAFDALPAGRPWHVAVLSLVPGKAGPAEYAREAERLVRKLKARQTVPVWCTLPAGADRAATVAANDAARAVMRAEGVEIADFYGATLNGLENRLEHFAAVLHEPLRRVLFSRSTPWSSLPPGEKRDPSRLLADDALLAAPMELPEVRGTHAAVYRAEEGEWQFNLHAFIAHYDGRFWAVWSSGRVNEDSSSQLIRYATSKDGLEWSAAEVLAPDPDGEEGPWRYMASGVYVDGGKLYALGSRNQGKLRGVGQWENACLVRFVWTGTGWREDRVIGEDAVVYFPPLKVEGRDFFVWRDSRANFYTALKAAGAETFEVTRMPGPMPEYRMSETGSYVDAAGAVHLIIRDQGYTRRLYHSVSFDAGATWTIPVKTNYPDAASKNMAGRLSNGWFYLINNPNALATNRRDPLAITFSRDGWTFEKPMALRKNAPLLRFKGGAKGGHSYQYSHAIEHDGKLWVIYATNKEDIEVSAFPIESFGLPR